MHVNHLTYLMSFLKIHELVILASLFLRSLGYCKYTIYCTVLKFLTYRRILRSGEPENYSMKLAETLIVLE